MDLADRKIIGWILIDVMSAERTTFAGLKKALKARPEENGLIFHSNRSVQYACNTFKDRLKALKINSIIGYKTPNEIEKEMEKAT